MPKRNKVYSEDSDNGDLERKRRKLRKQLGDLERKRNRRKRENSSDSSSISSGSDSSESENPDPVIVNDERNEDLSQNKPEEQEQDPEILKLLGEEPSGSDSIFGSEVHQALADRWTKFLTLGVEKAEIEAMEKKYPVPKNISYLKAPALNPELESSLTDQGRKEDKYSSIIQGHVGLSLSTIASCIDAILKGDECPITDIKSQILPSIVDAGKNLCGAFNMISTNRKYHVGINLNPMVKKIVKESKPDEFLCGNNFADKFKEVKTQLKTGKEMKNVFSTPKSFPSTSSSSFQRTQGRNSSLNYQRKFAKGRIKERHVERPQKREREYKQAYKPYTKRTNTK
ncbi:unnamed protein product [Ceutorhynchus assimilis]|uniref:Uncharacterized protein n=1 Tax=Ceutorhynchus assimilis TaxID=467358 RepID=A0A9N9MPL6_9CUCU|nr:unnamed protein product [Ceutorhynchus assimilis]